MPLINAFNYARFKFIIQNGAREIAAGTSSETLILYSRVTVLHVMFFDVSSLSTIALITVFKLVFKTVVKTVISLHFTG